VRHRSLALLLALLGAMLPALLATAARAGGDDDDESDGGEDEDDEDDEEEEDEDESDDEWGSGDDSASEDSSEEDGACESRGGGVIYTAVPFLLLPVRYRRRPKASRSAIPVPSDEPPATWQVAAEPPTEHRGARPSQRKEKPPRNTWRISRGFDAAMAKVPPARRPSGVLQRPASPSAGQLAPK
jgi:hypothetical protein